MEELSLVETLEEEFLAYIKKMEALEEALALVGSSYRRPVKRNGRSL